MLARGTIPERNCERSPVRGASGRVRRAYGFGLGASRDDAAERGVEAGARDELPGQLNRRRIAAAPRFAGERKDAS